MSETNPEITTPTPSASESQPSVTLSSPTDDPLVVQMTALVNGFLAKCEIRSETAQDASTEPEPEFPPDVPHFISGGVTWAD